MRKILVTLMASLLSCSAANAFWPEATDSSLEIGVGYRRDKIEWRTSADLFGSSDSSTCDNSAPFGIHSDLKWKNLRIWQIEARGEYVTCDNIYLRAYGDYGWIHSGKNSDSDSFTFDTGSDFEFSRTHAKTRGHVYDADIAIGYQFKLCDDSFSIAPLIGYSWKGQHLRDRNLRFDTLCDTEVTCNSPRSHCSDYTYSDYSDCSDSSYGSLNSRYHTRWNGPFIGFDLDYRFMCAWSLFLDYEYHFATYHAKANWNLRRDLPDGFHHRSKRAHGSVLDFGVRYEFCDCWSVALRGGFQWFEAKNGHDRALVAEESFGEVEAKCFVSIPLKHVKWHSESISIDVGMAF
ncbi:MAG: outer membrane beta-barrel protein [Candidatus Protochlamydia sp.]|nr:outer membrane beta-barrel protein [Candidatus Protochlamydia sp.]